MIHRHNNNKEEEQQTTNSSLSSLKQLGSRNQMGSECARKLFTTVRPEFPTGTNTATSTVLSNHHTRVLWGVVVRTALCARCRGVCRDDKMCMPHHVPYGGWCSVVCMYICVYRRYGIITCIVRVVRDTRAAAILPSFNTPRMVDGGWRQNVPVNLVGAKTARPLLVTVIQLLFFYTIYSYFCFVSYHIYTTTRRGIIIWWVNFIGVKRHGSVQRLFYLLIVLSLPPLSSDIYLYSLAMFITKTGYIGY